MRHRLAIIGASAALACSLVGSAQVDPTSFEAHTGAALVTSGMAEIARSFPSDVQIIELDRERQSLHRARKILTHAASKYPSGAFACIDLKTVALVDRITEGTTRQRAIVSHDARIMVLAVAYQDPTESDYLLERSFHHEIFHLIERRHSIDRDRDLEWRLLNVESFEYGKSTLNHASDPLEPTTEIAGFLSQYATSSILEDKAEMFSFIMADPDFVRKRAVTDPVVRSKRDVLMRRLSAWCHSFVGSNVSAD